MHCPLCQHTDCSDFLQDKRRKYLHCHNCDLVFVEPQYRPSPLIEKQEYDLHQNSSEDTGYLAFLNRARAPLIEAVPSPATGLDYGSGPNPVLAQWLSEDGYDMQYFDAFYASKPICVPETGFDFIISTEAIEHFHAPHVEWRLWMEWLAADGVLVIMTKRWLDLERFSRWHYKNDLTHVSFFHERTFEYLAARYGFSLKLISNDVVMMQRTR